MASQELEEDLIEHLCPRSQSDQQSKIKTCTSKGLSNKNSWESGPKRSKSCAFKIEEKLDPWHKLSHQEDTKQMCHLLLHTRICRTAAGSWPTQRQSLAWQLPIYLHWRRLLWHVRSKARLDQSDKKWWYLHLLGNPNSAPRSSIFTIQVLIYKCPLSLCGHKREGKVSILTQWSKVCRSRAQPKQHSWGMQHVGNREHVALEKCAMGVQSPHRVPPWRHLGKTDKICEGNIKHRPEATDFGGRRPTHSCIQGRSHY